MFMLRSTHEAAMRAEQLRAAVFKREYDRLIAEWNKLIDRINKRGGEEFLTHGILPSQQKRLPSKLTDDDVNKLLMLCHPDKHGGKQMAHDMTVKLLEMRK